VKRGHLLRGNPVPLSILVEVPLRRKEEVMPAEVLGAATEWIRFATAAFAWLTALVILINTILGFRKRKDKG